MIDNNYTSGNRRWKSAVCGVFRKFDIITKRLRKLLYTIRNNNPASLILMGSMVFSIVGGILAVIGYKCQTLPNYDIWTHALNGCLTGGLIGIISLLTLCTILRKQK